MLAFSLQSINVFILIKHALYCIIELNSKRSHDRHHTIEMENLRVRPQTLNLTTKILFSVHLQITTHILDTSRGLPAQNISVSLQFQDKKTSQFHILTHSTTDQDGRCSSLTNPSQLLVAGLYKLTFDVEKYYSELGVESFFPQVEVDRIIYIIN